MNFFNRNIKLIKNQSPILYKSILEKRGLDDYQFKYSEADKNFIITKDGKSCFLHSNYNVSREVAELTKRIDVNADVIIFFGIGLGYSLIDSDSVYKNIKKIIIIEPNLHVFKEFLKLNDIEKIFSKFNEVALIVNQNVDDAVSYLSDILVKTKIEKLEIIFLTAYKSLYKDYFFELHEKTKDMIISSTVNFSTIHAFKYLWIANIIKNLKREAIHINKIKGLFENRPVIIVSAGPSLNKNMHLLNEVYDKAYIVAVGSAIKILDNNNITPHIRMAIDGAKNQNKIFDGLNNVSIPLISSLMHYSGVQKEYEGHIIRVVLNGDYLASYIFNEAGETFETYDSGFSVANVALNIFCKLGCSKIILMGQDLAYSNGHRYAKGSWNEDSIDIDAKKYIKKKDIYGNDTYTDRAHLGMKLLFEKTIKDYNDKIIFLDATEGGLKIENTIIKTFKEVLLTDLEQDDKIFDVKEALNNESKMNLEYEMDSIVKKLRVDNLKIMSMALEIQNTLSSFNPSNSNNLDLKKINKLLKISENHIIDILKDSYFNQVGLKYLDQDIYLANRKYSKEGVKSELEKTVIEYNRQSLILDLIFNFTDVLENLLKEYFGEQEFNIIFK